MEPWFDTHVHLDRYAEPERKALLARATEADVALVSVAVDIESSTAVLALMGSSPVVAGAVVGLHPRNAAQWDERDARFDFRHPGVVGIGECGFDASGPEWEVQARAFVAQCAVARRLGKALVLHVDGDGAWAHLVDCGSELAGLRVVRHYFQGDGGQAAWHRERGHYLSFGNPLRREPALRDIAREYPEERLLIETDSYPMPDRNTEPAHVVKVGETLALVRAWTFDAARTRLAINTRTAFAL